MALKEHIPMAIVLSLGVVVLIFGDTLQFAVYVMCAMSFTMGYFWGGFSMMSIHKKTMEDLEKQRQEDRKRYDL